MSIPKAPLISEQEQLCCILPSKFCYSEVRGVTRETALHQRDADQQFYETLIEQARQEGRREVSLLVLKDSSDGELSLSLSVAVKLKEWGLEK